MCGKSFQRAKVCKSLISSGTWQKIQTAHKIQIYCYLWDISQRHRHNLLTIFCDLYSRLGHSTFQTCNLFSKTHLPNTVQHRGEKILLLQFQLCNLINIQFLKAKSSGRNVNHSSAPHQVSPDSAETGAAHGTPRNSCFLLPCVLELFKQRKV